MKKKILIYLVVLLSIGLLGCSKNPENNPIYRAQQVFPGEYMVPDGDTDSNVKFLHIKQKNSSSENLYIEIERDGLTPQEISFFRLLPELSQLQDSYGDGLSFVATPDHIKSLEKEASVQVCDHEFSITRYLLNMMYCLTLSKGVSFEGVKGSLSLQIQEDGEGRAPLSTSFHLFKAL